MTFDPHNLTPEISMNRVFITELGARAYDLLASHALTALIQEQAPALAQGSDPHRVFDAQLRAGNATAAAIAREFGQRLGHLLLTLRRGTAADRAARPEWSDAHWAHWATVRRVWLGGGLVSGALGEWLPKHALGVLHEAGCTGYALHTAPHNAMLPLIGAARRAPAGSDAALVFDFGQSRIKRGWASYQAGNVVTLHTLPPRASGAQPGKWDAIGPGDLLATMVRAIVETGREARAAGMPPTGAVLCSIAAYVQDGQPLATQHGLYTRLCMLPGTPTDRLAERISAETGQETRVTLLHDGTAAALAYAGTERAAVIMLGTALGIGFPPPAAGLHPLDAGFTVQEME